MYAYVYVANIDFWSNSLDEPTIISISACKAVIERKSNRAFHIKSSQILGLAQDCGISNLSSLVIT